MSKYSVEEKLGRIEATIQGLRPSHDGYITQAVALLRDYSERIKADEGAEVRLGEYLKSQAGYACLNDQSRRNVANTFLAVAYPNRPPAQADDTAMLDWLSLHPRGAEIVIDGQKRDCIFWGISSAPDNTLREAIAAAIQGEKHG